MANPDDRARFGARLAAVLIGTVITVAGLFLLGGGAYLIALGGSWYFALAGAMLVASGIFIGLQNRAGAWLYGAVLAFTAAWAVWEVGFAFWPLVSRLFAPAVIGVFVLLAAPLLTKGPELLPRRIHWGIAGALVLAIGATAVHAFAPGPIIGATAGPRQLAGTPDGGGTDWRFYGRTPRGTRFAPFDQINRDNVDQLKVAWTFRTGDIPTGGPKDAGPESQNTPIQAGDSVFVCTPHNIVYARDAETGAQRWKFDPKASSPLWQRCRGVGYYETPPQPGVVSSAATDTTALCAKRILLPTVDARLIALDAGAGTPCPQFGTGGTVDLKAGMGEVKPGFYFQTSMPTVIGDLVLIGGWVIDNVSVGEPSGVVRAFSARTGELVWAWDLGNPAVTKLPPEGETYTRGTPNVWSTPAFDAELGLVYLPTGNATPDFFGGQRTRADEENASSIVALDIATGRRRWKFQTVHHDLWDYDVPAQPALYDRPDGKGGTVPALIQATKRGQIFVLDRRTGVPLTKVEERPVPQGAAKGDWTAQTQPYSTSMPAIGNDRLNEAAMWGATPFDQLACRIAFRKLRYEGEFTPPGLTPSLQWPGYFGGMNWGSTAIDERTGYLIVNDTRSGQRVQLVPRAEADRAGAGGSHDGLSAQLGTPYGAAKSTFLSPLGIPCQRPPYGMLTAIDLATRKIAWQVPLGTVRDTGPLGIKMGLPIPVGMPTVGGPMATRSELVFYAGTLDYYLRAFDVANGAEVWKSRLPVGTQTTPMTYISPASGRQFVIVFAGGSRQSPDRGDYVIAYALPAVP